MDHKLAPISSNTQRMSIVDAKGVHALIWENKNDHHQSFCKSHMLEDGSQTSSHTSNTQRMSMLDAIGIYIFQSHAIL